MNPDRAIAHSNAHSMRANKDEIRRGFRGRLRTAASVDFLRRCDSELDSRRMSSVEKKMVGKLLIEFPDHEDVQCQFVIALRLAAGIFRIFVVNGGLPGIWSSTS